MMLKFININILRIFPAKKYLNSLLAGDSYEELK